MPTAKASNATNGAAAPAALDVIRVRGARDHNLRDIDLELPRNQLIAFCGVSGSGKTTMAIDTLYAEGQRRYMESFSTYTRQFLDQLDKPDADVIEGLPPAVAVTQNQTSRSNRATVATATEIADHLRLLFARIGRVICSGCGQEVHRDSPESIARWLQDQPAGRRGMLAYPHETDSPTWREELVEAGFVRAIIGSHTYNLDDPSVRDLPTGGSVLVVVDRLTTPGTSEGRLTESIESALHHGADHCQLLLETDNASPAAGAADIDGRRWQVFRFGRSLHCGVCDLSYTEPSPQLFNFNSPLGACHECEGFGSIIETDMGLVVPDPTKSLRQGAVAPWNSPSYLHELEELIALAPDRGIPLDVPFAELAPQHLDVVLHGSPEHEFGGLDGFFRWLERRKYKMHLRVFLSRWRSYRACEACGGSRLKPDALAVRIGGKNLAEVCGQTAGAALNFLTSLPLSDTEQQVGQVMLNQVRARLEYLVEVGLAYLPLDRSLRTLSSGESQRVAMTSTLGSSLVDMLYVLDEPTAGLHHVDVKRLTGAIHRLRDRGNTVIVVDHEEDVIAGADQAVEFGPAAGVDGGRIVFQGPPARLCETPDSSTGDWLAGRRSMVPGGQRRAAENWVELTGASGNNLQEVDLRVPLGVLSVVTGVSGAGKSSLVLQTLYPALVASLGKENGRSADQSPLPYASLSGSAHIDNVVQVDQQAISRSPRSNPVTYIKAFDPIRAVFAEQPDAQTLGLTSGHFSFNVEGGRCETCQGAGRVEVDMQFLADITMRCRECDGRRYRPEVLGVKYRGRDISEVLEMSAQEAFRFFRGHKKVQQKLKVLLDVGLGYVPLGQPSSTLSGGEAQRLKLAGSLAGKQTGRSLFVMDEPTRGLHFSDIVRLIDCFDALLEVGHSLLVIEHNVQLILAADHVIDLGPGAAGEGGRIVATGTPEQVAKKPDSATGRSLAEALRKNAEAVRELDDE
ncbi:UvrABC system protein A [Posidoniimonas polymericola]|uniref:UvrABC system protein A n=1 Tax=Posidoniimonas polymericola TaxID=2528002 RepID=A0A5C5YQG9_9BACT|nr:excinuclease ABC subunit UvrA [Posidoniimonas polymericola]TWT77089.1 UvrABC system protein A [Posidoniimonas polymericola]